MKKMINLKVFILSLVIVFGVALLGSFFTSPNTGSEWYNSIKPTITPPNWIFPVVWNILFFLIALSLYFSWIASKTRNNKTKIAVVFGINFILNILWGIFFFAMQKPLFAFYELLLLWLSILIMICTTYKISKKSAYLLIPYLLWVTFAGVLNYLIAF